MKALMYDNLIFALVKDVYGTSNNAYANNDCADNHLSIVVLANVKQFKKKRDKDKSPIGFIKRENDGTRCFYPYEGIAYRSRTLMIISRFLCDYADGDIYIRNGELFNKHATNILPAGTKI